MAADVSAGKVETLNGAKAEISIKEGKVMIDKATIVKTDIVGSNGVIHVIDSVILQLRSNPLFAEVCRKTRIPQGVRFFLRESDIEGVGSRWGR